MKHYYVTEKGILIIDTPKPFFTAEQIRNNYDSVQEAIASFRNHVLSAPINYKATKELINRFKGCCIDLDVDFYIHEDIARLKSN